MSLTVVGCRTDSTAAQLSDVGFENSIYGKGVFYIVADPIVTKSKEKSAQLDSGANVHKTFVFRTCADDTPKEKINRYCTPKDGVADRTMPVERLKAHLEQFSFEEGSYESAKYAKSQMERAVSLHKAQLAQPNVPNRERLAVEYERLVARLAKLNTIITDGDGRNGQETTEAKKKTIDDFLRNLESEGSNMFYGEDYLYWRSREYGYAAILDRNNFLFLSKTIFSDSFERAGGYQWNGCVEEDSTSSSTYNGAPRFASVPGGGCLDQKSGLIMGMTTTVKVSGKDMTSSRSLWETLAGKPNGLERVVNSDLRREMKWILDRCEKDTGAKGWRLMTWKDFTAIFGTDFKKYKGDYAAFVKDYPEVGFIPNRLLSPDLGESPGYLKEPTKLDGVEFEAHTWNASHANWYNYADFMPFYDAGYDSAFVWCVRDSNVSPDRKPVTN